MKTVDRDTVAMTNASGVRTIDDLVADQGVKPIHSMGALPRGFWPEDETIDDFLAAVRKWRRNDFS